MILLNAYVKNINKHIKSFLIINIFKNDKFNFNLKYLIYAFIYCNIYTKNK